MKRFNKLLVFLAIFFINISCVFASNKINRIDIDVVLDENGNGFITEYWDMHVDSKTEVYKSLTDLGNSEVSNFTAYMDDTMFDYVNHWNINGSFSDKAYKNGINRVANGVELCWGMSNYGNHIYKITYNVSNMIYNTEDGQVLYWRFIDNNVMDPGTRYYKVRVTGPNYYSDTLPVWGYGDEGGYAFVNSGEIIMSNADDGHLSSDEYVVLLAEYEPGTFNTTNSYSGYDKFDDFYTIAQDGASIYSDNIDEIFGIFFTFLSLVIWVVIPIIAVLGAFGSVDKYDKKELIDKEILPYRDIPCDKNISKAYLISNIYGLNKKKEDYFGALFLKWILEKKLKVVKQNKSGLLKSGEVTALQLYDGLSFDSKIEEDMYNYLKSASGDMLLEENELKKWCRRNYGKFFKAFDDIIKEERNALISEGHITVDEKKKHLFHLDEVIYNDAVKLAGLKKFFKEFARMQEKQPIEVNMWKYYLIYASIFGMAKEVSRQFEKLYPELLKEYEDTDSNSIFWTYMWINNITTSSVSAASSARSAAQSYSSGGGGFSSGGGGGGSFGGGGGGCR